jgi:hypothetical protein
MKGEEAFDWNERFPQVLIGQGKSSQGGVKWKALWSLKLVVGCVKCCECCKRNVWEGKTDWVCLNLCEYGLFDAPPSSLLDPKRVQLCQIAEEEGTWCHS